MREASEAFDHALVPFRVVEGAGEGRAQGSGRTLAEPGDPPDAERLAPSGPRRARAAGRETSPRSGGAGLRRRVRSRDVPGRAPPRRRRTRGPRLDAGSGAAGRARGRARACRAGSPARRRAHRRARRRATNRSASAGARRTRRRRRTRGRIARRSLPGSRGRPRTRSRAGLRDRLPSLHSDRCHATSTPAARATRGRLIVVARSPRSACRSSSGTRC